MNITIKPGFPEEANVGITSIAVVLNELFAKYEQLSSLEEAEQVSPGQVVMPILAFEPLRLFLKSNAIKNTFLIGRYTVYSKQPEDTKPCARFIFAERCKPKEEVLETIPNAIQYATFVKDGEETVLDWLLKLGGIDSDKVSYFYNVTNCEGVHSHCLAVIHEFGKEGDPHCVATAYFKVDINK